MAEQLPQRITIIHDTFIKSELLGSQDLGDSEKAKLTTGHELVVDSISPAKNQHVKLTLTVGLVAEDAKTELKTVYAYIPHLDYEQKQKAVRLDLPYFSQVNNDATHHGPGWRQCNLTSCTMLADYLLDGELSRKAKDQGYAEPESYYGAILAKHGDTINHDAQTAALKELGIESYFSRSLSPEDVIQSLNAGVPTVCGFAFSSSGHICLIVGYEPSTQTWLVHDPYGIRHGASDSYDVGADGSFDRYSQETMQKIFWDMGGESGWGRICTKVDGNPTGLPEGL